MVNKHWPYIKKQAPSLLDLDAFFTLLEFLIDKQILKQFDENFDEGDVFISYVITSSAYLIVANDPCLRRTIIAKARNLILAQIPPKSIDVSTGEAGFCLETLLFGDKVDSIGLQDGEYLLKTANWNVVNVGHFQREFKQAVVKDKRRPNQDRLKLPSRCIEGPSHGTRIRIGGCGTSQYAIHLNN
ncbi:unnamed protein product [Rotaria sordida]|uniref:Uncharacterized protein n=1 Tax=Rotaria sordida TaxID=392033 RepID=A0A814VXR6_9BILA|nr:unnamed protein product [Rotaria sordida]CAF1196358.1 unnamed protein product [Rotaria sordida]CAF1462094.1 unnamed protein product [Rotaria sordida]CAF1465894.1 unnamed protein product [Rotaria sordida]